MKITKNTPIGTKVRILWASDSNVNKAGDIGVISEHDTDFHLCRVQVIGREGLANWSGYTRLELFTTIHPSKDRPRKKAINKRRTAQPKVKCINPEFD